MSPDASTTIMKYARPDLERFFEASLADIDPDLKKSIDDELGRQQNQIELIASENIVSKAVLEAQGSIFTNKYAEGYPGKRYYQGCHPSDEVETLAIERAKKLFDCGFVNVQPHSGAQANGAVLLALVQPGDTILGMSLDAGGHLTHGAAPAMSGTQIQRSSPVSRHSARVSAISGTPVSAQAAAALALICAAKGWVASTTWVIASVLR